MRRPDIARLRLLFALAVSIAFHLGLLAARIPGEAPHRGAAVALALEVRFVPVAATEPEPAQLQREPAADAAEPTPAPGTVQTRIPARRAHSRPERHIAPVVPADDDVRYYAVHELDMFPRLAHPLVLDPPAARANNAADRLRLELLIDADGLVRGISALDTGQPESAVAAARRLWKDARFYPARRSGRVVASRIVMEVAYEPAGAAR